MSYQLTAWAVRQRTGSATRKAVLMALANCTNHQNNVCEPKIRDLAEETEMSERSVRRALTDLEEGTFIERRMQHDTNGYRLGYSYRFPHLTDTESERAGRPTGQGDQWAESPVKEQEDLEQDLGQKDLPPVAPPILPSLPEAVPRKVGRVPVAVGEAELAVGVLAAYNELTGQGYASGDWLAKIVMRLREHPELDLDDHRRVLEVALAAPWWDGRPAPNVVYGNAALFERCLDAALAAPLRNGATSAKGGQKFGRRDVAPDEFEALAERIGEAQRLEAEGRRELESG